MISKGPRTNNCAGLGVACPVAGDGWLWDNAGPGCRCIFSTCNCCDFGGNGLRELKSHVVTFLVAGESLSFTFAPTFSSCFTGAEDFTARWIPAPGNNHAGVTITPQGGAADLFLVNDGSHQMVESSTFNTYHPQTFTIGFPDGRQFVMDGTTGLLVH